MDSWVFYDDWVVWLCVWGLPDIAMKCDNVLLGWEMNMCCMANRLNTIQLLQQLGIWNSRKLISIARVIFSINLSHGFTPIPHLDIAKSPWNSRKLVSIPTVIFSINLSHGFTPYLIWIQPKVNGTIGNSSVSLQ